MGGLTARIKGQRGEREVAALLRQYGFEARRGLQAQGEVEPDVVTALPGFRIEVKRQERLNIWQALRQVDDAIDPADDETVPLLVFRRNRTRWYACLSFEDLLQILVRLELYRKDFRSVRWNRLDYTEDEIERAVPCRRAIDA